MGRIKQFVLAFICLFSFSVASEHVRNCDELVLPEHLSTKPFKYEYNSWLSSYTPHHSANDLIIQFGEETTFEGKFSYGSFSRDLEEEIVEIWLDSCADELLHVGEYITNHSGKINYEFKDASLLPPGTFQIWLRVQGDGTVTNLI